MDTATLFLLALPMIFAGVVWHSLLGIIGKQHLKNSISENALQSRRVLYVHRVIHVVISLCFIMYSYVLLQRGYGLSALLLSLGAIFDIVQAMTLSKRTNHTPLYIRDIHQFSAWMMAASYLTFAIVIGLERNISPIVLVIFTLWISIMYVISHRTKHQYFYFAQMGFFISVMVAMILFAVA